MASVDDIYREEFRARVLAGRPRSVLEIGSGRGVFLRSVKAEVNRLVGLDPDADAVEALQAEGFEAVKGFAEKLPFHDHEFDVVVFSFSPHHCSDWAVALNEAMRVARHSIEILDIWYDDSIADQRVARDFDRWRKAIDRLNGMVHHDTQSPGALLAPLVEERGLTYDYVCRRVSSAWALDEVEGIGRDYVQRAGSDAALAKGFEQILADAKRHGISEEGCVQMTIELGR